MDDRWLWPLSGPLRPLNLPPESRAIFSPTGRRVLAVADNTISFGNLEGPLGASLALATWIEGQDNNGDPVGPYDIAGRTTGLDRPADGA